MRVTATIITLCAAAACGDDGSTIRDAAVDVEIADAPVDAMPDAPANNGFGAPTAPVTASMETSPNVYEPTALDMSCLGVARSDTPTSVSVSLTLTVRDFQSDNLMPSATVAAFDGLEYTAPFATTTSDSNGVATITLPTGTTRHGFQITHTNARATYTLDLLANPTAASQARTAYTMSNATVATLPALVGETQLAAEAIVIGRLFDCAQHPVNNAIATISSTPAIPTHLPGVRTFYFAASVGLPVRHTSQPDTDVDGRFMILHVPATTTAYVQMWGYPTANDVATNNLRLIAEVPVTIVAGNVFMADHDPRATH